MSLLEVRPRALAAGVASFVPGLDRLTNRASGGSDSARYCYSVWLRHLVRAHASGLPTQWACFAELGPGDSLGIGLAALLCGAEHAIGLDVKAHANAPTNLRIFDELVQLFRARAAIPGDSEFPGVRPTLSTYAFPHGLLPEDSLRTWLAETRLDQIRSAIAGRPGPITLAYAAPWKDPSVIDVGRVDFFLSQAVLEHVDDLDTAYGAMRKWMKPGAAMSHAIDFSSHDLTRHWNGHWTLGDATWRLVRGTRSYLINRQPLSVHLALLARNGFQPVCVERARADAGHALRPARRFREMDAEDASTRGVFLQAIAPVA